LSQRPSGDWRADLRLFARHMLGMLRRHTWLPSLISSRTLPGPNTLRYVEVFLSELDGLGLDFNTIGGILSTVDAYVDGFARRVGAPEEDRRRRGMPEGECHPALPGSSPHALSSVLFPIRTRAPPDITLTTADAGFDFGRECVPHGTAPCTPPARRD